MTPTMPVNQPQFESTSIHAGNFANKTMSSREIAELTGKRHAHVIRDIRAMLIGLYGDEEVERLAPEQYRNRHSEYVRENADTIFSAIVGDEPNRVHLGRGFAWHRDKRGYITGFDLDRSHSITVVTGYNVKARKAIIDRWEELEGQLRQAPQIDLNNPADLRFLLANYANDKIELQAQVASMETTVAAFNQIADASGSMCGTDAGKHLGIGRKALFAFMRQNRWLYRRPGTNYDLAYQDKIEAGLLEHKVTTVHSPDGTERIHTQARITPKGLAKLAKLIPPTVRLVTGAA